MTRAAPLYTPKTHLADRPGKARCGIDTRDLPVTPAIERCTCGMCLNLARSGRNNCSRPGDWIRQ